jgi:methylenetetrahydrofolate reductase (NADPH)
MPRNAHSPANNRFRRTLESGHFAVTAEVTPPRGASLASLTTCVRDLAPVVCAINLTDGAGARVRLSSLAAAIHVKQLGLEPILQVTCRDRNRLALQADLLGAAAFGIENLLLLSGDSVAAGDDPDTRPVFDLDTRGLLAVVESMCVKGRTLSGSELDTPARFFPGVAAIPFEPGTGWTADGLAAKKQAGARFVQTQFCYDMELLERYLKHLRAEGLLDGMFLLVGLGPLRSADSARWMRDSLPGTIMPDGIIRRMEAARDPRQEGIVICAELIRDAREIEGVAGVHLMAPGRHQAIVETVQLAGLA